MVHLVTFLFLCGAVVLVAALGECEEKNKTLHRILQTGIGLVAGIGLLALVGSIPSR